MSAAIQAELSKGIVDNIEKDVKKQFDLQTKRFSPYHLRVSNDDKEIDFWPSKYRVKGHVRVQYHYLNWTDIILREFYGES